jgi:hypothetical protein
LYRPTEGEATVPYGHRAINLPETKQISIVGVKANIGALSTYLKVKCLTDTGGNAGEPEQQTAFQMKSLLSTFKRIED